MAKLFDKVTSGALAQISIPTTPNFFAFAYFDILTYLNHSYLPYHQTWVSSEGYWPLQWPYVWHWATYLQITAEHEAESFPAVSRKGNSTPLFGFCGCGYVGPVELREARQNAVPTIMIGPTINLTERMTTLDPFLLLAICRVKVDQRCWVKFCCIKFPMRRDKTCVSIAPIESFHFGDRMDHLKKDLDVLAWTQCCMVPLRNVANDASLTL